MGELCFQPPFLNCVINSQNTSKWGQRVRVMTGWGGLGHVNLMWLEKGWAGRQEIMLLAHLCRFSAASEFAPLGRAFPFC